MTLTEEQVAFIKSLTSVKFIVTEAAERNALSIHNNTNPPLDASQMSVHKKTLLDIELIDYDESRPDWMLYVAGLCVGLGATTVVVNLFVMVCIVLNRARTLRNTFYLIALHCCVIDMFRGSMLVCEMMPYFLATNDSLTMFHLNNHILLFLRVCNLMTIFNLMAFTANEFFVIKYPLRNRIKSCSRLLRRSMLIGWMCSTSFVLIGAKLRGSTWDRKANPLQVLVSIYSVFLATFCAICVVVVILAYTLILIVIRKHKFSPNISGGRRFQRRDFEHKFQSEIIQPECSRNDVKTINDQSTHQQAASIHPNLPLSSSQSASSNHNKSHHDHTSQMDLNGGAVEKNVESSTMSNYLVPGRGTLPLSKSTPLLAADSANQQLALPDRVQSTTSSSATPILSLSAHYLSRYKFVLVIGLVITITVLFLVPYSVLQIGELLVINRVIHPINQTVIMLRWSVQVIIGFHTVLQPLCYFRMAEFRRFAAGLFTKRIGLNCGRRKIRLPTDINRLRQVVSSISKRRPNNTAAECATNATPSIPSCIRNRNKTNNNENDKHNTVDVHTDKPESIEALLESEEICMDSCKQRNDEMSHSFNPEHSF